MARIQTFPDEFVVLGSVSDAQKQLRNAASPFTEKLARTIKAQLLHLPLATAEPSLQRTAAGTPPPLAERPADVPPCLSRA